MEATKRFESFFYDFRSRGEWTAMKNTREDSPWHREENVAVHTRMALDWYVQNLSANRSDHQYLLTSCALLFHDVGKPAAQITKHSEERGEYRAYHGHEQLSSRMWVDYALSNRDLIMGTDSLLRFTINDIANIALMIEYHVPFALKDVAKRKALKTAVYSRMEEGGHRAWLDMLLSDQHGRISDGQAEKLAAVDSWLAEWETV